MKPYFSHDEGARNDPKLVEVLMTLGHEGKSVYWDLVEMLYEQGGYLMLSQCKGYAFALRTDCDLIKKLVNDFELFATDGEKFWSETALRRLTLRNAKSEKAKESAAKRWSNSERNANALPTQSEGNAIKEKEIKENERVGKPTPSLRSVRGGKEPEHFAAFWLAYPRKEAKANALKAFEKLTAEEQAAAPLAAREWFGRRTDWQGADGTDYRPHPTTWLNQKRWTDLTELTITPTQPNPQPFAHGYAQRHAVNTQLVNDDKRNAAFEILASLGI